MWISLGVFCGFVMWDTQMIILKKRRGDGDFIGHSLELFIDFIQIVKNIIVLLINKVTNSCAEDSTKKCLGLPNVGGGGQLLLLPDLPRVK